jgi:replicative DNA helicase
MILCDPSAERAVLSCICKYGDRAFIEVSDLLSESTFTIDSNQILWKCLYNILSRGQISNIDIPSIYSSAQELGLLTSIQNKEETQHIKAIFDFPINIDNIKIFATKIKKLEIARSLHEELTIAQEKLLDVTGSESISEILNIAEDTVFDFTSKLSNSEDNAPDHVAEGIDEYIQYLIDNPISQVGISTGFPVYDQSIGGGLRKSTVNVIAARPKTGKTLLADNMGFYIANKLKIPVLNMDTEMTKEDTGKFTDSPIHTKKIQEIQQSLKETPLYYKTIAGKPFDEQLSIMKRWVVQTVGLNDDGSAKDCVIFYDYLKLMDTSGLSQDLKEYQVLGFMMTSLHNFASKYKIPIVAFVQLNRDGITKESTDTASGSDRIIWLCSNFTIFKRKSDEEIAEDGQESGNRKLIPIISRHGGGLDDNDYINCHMKGWCAKISEGSTKLEISNNNTKKDGFVIDNNNEEEIPFA